MPTTSPPEAPPRTRICLRPRVVNRLYAYQSETVSFGESESLGDDTSMECHNHFRLTLDTRQKSGTVYDPLFATEPTSTQ